jgi:catechol 2,3-dioxygenase-like lactoylglutathione lyase family enzyme
MFNEARRMIKTKRLAYVTLETPDLERQIDYYVHIFGLALAGREKGRAFLSTPLGQQAVVLESGAQARCTKVAFEADPAEDLAAIAKALAGNGITAAARAASRPPWRSCSASRIRRGPKSKSSPRRLRRRSTPHRKVSA